MRIKGWKRTRNNKREMRWVRHEILRHGLRQLKWSSNSTYVTVKKINRRWFALLTKTNGKFFYTIAKSTNRKEARKKAVRWMERHPRYPRV